jgi:hypothetical protein
MVELSFYWSLSISQFFDVKRKVVIKRVGTGQFVAG